MFNEIRCAVRTNCHGSILINPLLLLAIPPRAFLSKSTPFLTLERKDILRAFADQTFGSFRSLSSCGVLVRSFASSRWFGNTFQRERFDKEWNLREVTCTSFMLEIVNVAIKHTSGNVTSTLSRPHLALMPNSIC